VHSRKKWLALIAILFVLLPDELLAEEDEIWIFVSFSMPEQSLRQWMQQANNAGATVIMRGFYKKFLTGKHKETIDVTSRRK